MQHSISKKSKIKHSRSDIVFFSIDTFILILFFIVVLYPLLFVIVSSFSPGSASVNAALIPKKLTLEGYKAVFEFADVWRGYWNSAIYTVSYTVIALIVTICCAYPLSRKDFKGGPFIMGLCVFTMYFSGGLIPTYLWIRQLKMLNTAWSLLIPGSLSVYNMIVMRTFFSTQIPDELHEAAMIDGCSDFRFLVQVVLPLSTAILAVIGLYYFVGMWNDYFYPMIYISNRKKLPLPNILNEILTMTTRAATEMTAGKSMSAEEMAVMGEMEQRIELMKYSLIIVACLPVLMIYPFVQKFFVKGVMIGAIKG